MLSTLKFYDDLGIHVIHQMCCVDINKTPSNSHDRIKYAVNKTFSMPVLVAFPNRDSCFLHGLCLCLSCLG